MPEPQPKENDEVQGKPAEKSKKEKGTEKSKKAKAVENSKREKATEKSKKEKATEKSKEKSPKKKDDAKTHKSVKQPAKKGGSPKPLPDVSVGEVINNRFVIIKLLGKGGFGAVYEVNDDKTKEKAALKLELRKPPPTHPNLKLEMHVLKRVQKNEHFTKFIETGEHRGILYLAMQLVGQNLGDMRKSCPDRKFTFSTAHRAALQMFEAIEHMHKVELLHRDIKPGNYAIGYTRKDVKTIYLLDFGLVRKYTGKTAGKFRPQRGHAPFRGTRRYASPNMLKEKEGSTHDDLISWLYAVVECFKGSLPFPSGDIVRKELGRIKLGLADELFQDMHSIWRPIYDSLIDLKYGDRVNYIKIRKDLDAVLIEKKIDFKKDTYDWEENGGTFSAIIRQTMAKGPPKKADDEVKEKFNGKSTGDRIVE